MPHGISQYPGILHLHHASPSEHHEPDPARDALFQLVPLVDTAVDRVRFVVEEIIVQLAVAGAKLLLLQEERVVHQGERVEHVKILLLGQDEGVGHQGVQARLEGGAVVRRREGHVARVVEQVGGADRRVFLGLDDRGLEAIEGEKVGDFAVSILEGCEY